MEYKAVMFTIKMKTKAKRTRANIPTNNKNNAVENDLKSTNVKVKRVKLKTDQKTETVKGFPPTIITIT